MSSNEDDYPNESENTDKPFNAKKRRIQRACDICRRKKSDGVQMPGNRCSNCIAYSFECTYVEAAKKRGPPKGYVESLENRLEKVEGLLRRLCPDVDFSKDIDPETFVVKHASVSTEIDPYSGLRPHKILGSTTIGDVVTSDIRGIQDNLTDEDTEQDMLSQKLGSISLDPIDNRFFGKSSGMVLIKTALELKREVTGAEELLFHQSDSRREKYWTRNRVNPDLILNLVDLYFIHMNLYLPLLHRQTLDRAIAEGLHHNDEMFGATLLLICAVSARFSSDPRVLLEDDTDSFRSAGWKWFNQVHMVKNALLTPPTVYDLQFYCLSVQFLQGTSAPQACWTMVGVGIRLAQDIGAHRRRAIGPPTAEYELWKRAFWVLLLLDRSTSALLGRPCAIQDEDFDVEMPLEVDDEYWDHPDPSQRFLQPANKPSLITAFSLSIRLSHVLAIALRTIYAINKSKILLGFVGKEWEQHLVAELDSALNQWVDSVPDHLRWDPGRENSDFFGQSTLLYCCYYQTQILIHRPFIPSPRKPSPLSFPSLAICTNAARSCSHIVDAFRKRNCHSNLLPQAQVITCAFTAGIVLLLNMWGGKRAGLSSDPNKEMVDVHRCMRILRGCEDRWPMAGRLWDILCELASVGDLPLPRFSPPASNKRERDAEDPIVPSLASSESPPPRIANIEGLRNIAGARRALAKEAEIGRAQSYSIPNPTPTPNPHQEIFPLPVYGDELGRLPLHGQVKTPIPQDLPQDEQFWFPPPPSVPSVNASSSRQHTNYQEPILQAPPSYGMGEFFYGQTQAEPTTFTPEHRPHPVNSMYRSNDVTSSLVNDLDPGQQYVPTGHTSNSHPRIEQFAESDTITMWSNAPTGFELDDWGAYLSHVSAPQHPRNA
ncbi:fungal-specific transcription factor domain-containing protein [Infundibulicybe gibba]|nr:fungal-specific transcription factor domain-containing protein [Infundibulicybe gibba]